MTTGIASRESVAEKVKEPSILSNLSEGLISYLDFQEKLIAQIQSRLHLIINRSSPENTGKDIPPIPTYSDFSSLMTKQYGRLSDHNELLRRILSHLEEII